MRTEQEVEQLKQIWALMLQHGKVFPEKMEWNYYSGGFEMFNTDYKERTDARLALLAKIKDIGVNFYQTDVPEYHCYSKFVDSYSPSDDVDVWEGMLILNDDTKVFVGAKNIDLKERVAAFKNRTEDEDLVVKFFGE